MNRVGRVLMTTDTLGGVLQYAVELSLGLAGQGIQVILATMGGPLPADLKDRAARARLDSSLRERVQTRVDGRPMGRRRPRGALVARPHSASAAQSGAHEWLHPRGFAFR